MIASTPTHVREVSRYVPPVEVSLVSRPVCGSLHVAGDVSLLERPAVAVVGSRRASPAALEEAASVSVALVRNGFVVISGLAAGIDAAAHEAAIRAGGSTIAVIGTSLERVYPMENARLQERIHREHLLVSPFPPGTRTAPWHFPKRNRLMARLAQATVLVEAGEKSGTRHQVEESLRVGRQVLVRRGLAEDVVWLRRARDDGKVREWENAGDVVRLGT